MTFLFDVNNESCTGPEAVYLLKELLKSAGWTVKASSDGTTYNATSDIILSGSSGASGLANNSAWFRIQDPIAQREFVIQRGTSNPVWRVAYSASSKFTSGGSASVLPTATDQQFIIGSSGATASWFTTDNTYRWHGGADNADGYGFWAAGIAVGGATNPNHIFLFEPMKSGSYNVLDIDPYIIYTEVTGAVCQATDFRGTGVNGWARKGFSDETWVNWHGEQILSNVSVEIYPSGVGTNPFNGKDTLISLVFGRPTRGLSGGIAMGGFKGIAQNTKWNAIARTTGTTLTIETIRDRIILGDINVPWNGSNPVI